MSDLIYLIPKPGLTVPGADGVPLPAEGKWVPNDRFWRRRRKDGDVTEGKPPSAAKKKES